MVQHKAAQFVTNTYPKKGSYEDYSISKILSSLNWDTLEERRIKARLTMCYKIINGHLILTPDYLPKSNQIRPSRSCNTVKVGTLHQLQETQSKLSNPSKTFFFEAPTLWNNNVTPSQASALSVESFQKQFSFKS